MDPQLEAVWRLMLSGPGTTPKSRLLYFVKLPTLQTMINGVYCIQSNNYVHREEIASHLTHQVVCAFRIDLVKVNLLEDVLNILETINETIQFTILVGSKQACNLMFLALS